MDDYFQRLGLPQSFTLDPTAVERSYLEKSRALHPDFFQNAPESERRASLSLTAALNEAYVALRDPYRRAEHLLALQNGPSAGQAKNLDQAFLMEMMELREQIDEARTNGRPLDAFEKQLRERLDTLLTAAGRPFDERRELSPEERAAVRSKLNAAKTVMSLLRDLNET